MCSSDLAERNERRANDTGCVVRNETVRGDRLEIEPVLDRNGARGGQRAARAVLPVQLAGRVVPVLRAIALRVRRVCVVPRVLVRMRVQDDRRETRVAELHGQPRRERARHVSRRHQQLRNDRDCRECTQQRTNEPLCEA